MNSISIYRLTNANMYDEGKSLLGAVEEIQLPAIKGKSSDVKALGMMMDFELPSGFEKMTGKVKFNSINPELFERFGSPYITRSVQVRGNLEKYDTTGRSSQVPVVAFLTIRFKDVLPAITLKQNDNPEQESEFTCTYYRLEIDGKSMIEVDAFTNTFFVAGKDQLSAYKKALGF